MTDLSNLPPEVREAIVFLDNSTEDDVDVPDSVRHWQAIRQYAISVTAERDELQGANEYHRLALVLAQKQIAELAAERDARGDSKPLNE